MFNKSKKIIVVWIVGVISILALHHQVILSPNYHLYKSDYDAIKNYYVYKYYIDNNDDMLNFEGMNYPYGDNLIFSDAQPPIAFVLKSISKYFPAIKNYNIAIMHFLMLLSFLLSFYLFYKIFIHLKVNFYFSLIGALSIMLLSPQFMRLLGHYSLTYSFFFPLVILYFLKQNKYSNFIAGFSILFAFFLHPYIGLSLTLMVLLIYLFRILFNKSNDKLSSIKSIIIQGLIPLIIFFISVQIMDTHVNRSTNPAGIREYHASTNTIFTAQYEPVHSLYSIFFDTSNQTAERMSYIGFISIITIGFLLYFLVKKIIRKNKYNIPISKSLLILFLSSFLLLLFSFGIPHVYGFPKLLDIIPYLRQFRALARFAWFFYYSMGVISIVLLYYFYKTYNSNKIVKIFSIVGVLIFLSEAVMYQVFLTGIVGKDINKFDINNAEEYKAAISKINPNNYQAIIPIPFFHVGSENHKINASGESIQNTMIFSYHLKMPIWGSMGSRTSINETQKSASILLPNFYKKTIEEDIKSPKDFLMILSKGTLTKSENDIVNIGKLLYKSENFSLYAISKKDIFEYKKYRDKVFNNFLLLNDSLHIKNDFVMSDTSKYFKYISFDDKKTQIKYNGYGVLALNKKADNTIFTIDPGTLDSTKNYTLNFWFYNKGSGQTNFQMMWEECNKFDSGCNWNHATDARFSKTIIGDWSLIEYNFTPPSNSTKYTLYFPKRDNGIDSVYIDDVLLRESDLDIYKVEDFNKKGLLFYNNYLIKSNFDYAVLSSSKEIFYEYYKDEIYENEEWLNEIKNNIQKNKDLTFEINSNIEYMISSKGYNVPKIEKLKQLYYKNKIISNKSWLQELTLKAQKKGISLDSIIYLDSHYMAEKK